MDTSRMILRSAVPKPIVQENKATREEERLNRPLITYDGKINYCTKFFDCAGVCDELLKKAEAIDDILVLGFDLEWHFNFQTGPGKVAVMQINPDVNTCHIIHMSVMSKIPKGLSELLMHPKIRLTGINIKSDVRKLSRDYPGFKPDKLLENCIELNALANSILPFQQRWSMEKLVGHFFKMNIDKSKSVRMSRWHKAPLSEKQMLYAAIDSYASLKLYLHLREMEINNKIHPEELNETCLY